MRQGRRADENERERVKMRDGGAECKAENTPASEESSTARGSVPVLNISITD